MRTYIPIALLLLLGCGEGSSDGSDAGTDTGTDGDSDTDTDSDDECTGDDTFDPEDCPDVSDITDCVVYVDADAPDGGDGRSWATAVADLQDGLDLATCGVLTTDYCQSWQVWAAEGSYYAWRTCEELDTFWIRSGVHLYGGFAGDETAIAERDPAAHATVIDGREGPGGEHRVWTAVLAYMADDVRLDGLVVRDGAAPLEEGQLSGGALVAFASGVIEGCAFEANQGFWGGGLNIHESTIAISDSVFKNNLAEYGAGLATQQSQIAISDCTFESNSATETGWGSAIYFASGTDATVVDTQIVGNQGNHAAMIAMESLLEMSGCLFEGNANTQNGAAFLQYTYAEISDTSFIDNATTGTEGAGGGLLFDGHELELDSVAFHGNSAAYGGGLASAGGQIEITGTSFEENTAGLYGGGIFAELGTGVVTDCTFRNNSAGENGGGAAFVQNESVHVSGTLFAGNTSGEFVGALSTGWNESLVVERCTFAGNVSEGGGSTIDIQEEQLQLTDSILWDDCAPAISLQDETPDPIVTYSDVRGGWAGDGNIDADPLFVDPDGGDYCLQEGSPCIGAANDAGDMGYCPYESL